MRTPVLILAAGEAVRFHGIRKQLITLPDGDTLLSRQIRQVQDRAGAPLVVTSDDALTQYAQFSGAEVCVPHDDRFLVSTLLSTMPFWGKARTIVLLGDVLYSKSVMDGIFARQFRLGMWANGRDVFALSFNSQHWVGIELGLRQAIVSAEEWRRTGNLRSWFEIVFPTPFVVDVTDYTCDFDTPAEQRAFNRHVGDLDDRRTDGR